MKTNLFVLFLMCIGLFIVSCGSADSGGIAAALPPCKKLNPFYNSMYQYCWTNDTCTATSGQIMYCPAESTCTSDAESTLYCDYNSVCNGAGVLYCDPDAIVCSGPGKIQLTTMDEIPWIAGMCYLQCLQYD